MAPTLGAIFLKFAVSPRSGSQLSTPSANLRMSVRKPLRLRPLCEVLNCALCPQKTFFSFPLRGEKGPDYFPTATPLFFYTKGQGINIPEDGHSGRIILKWGLCGFSRLHHSSICVVSFFLGLIGFHFELALRTLCFNHNFINKNDFFNSSAKNRERLNSFVDVRITCGVRNTTSPKYVAYCTRNQPLSRATGTQET